jgi:acyl-CoA synthetase (AMP-forming)/AMP-acid ligase II
VPDGVALADSRREVTWAGLRDTTRVIARTLRDSLAPGDRLLVHSVNRVEVLEAYLACAAAGSVAAPVNPSLTDPELDDAISLLRPAAAAADAAGRERLGRLVPGLACWDIGGFGEEPSGMTPPPLPAPPLTAPFAILQTSATTGRPKGVIIDQRSVQLNAFSWLADVRPSPGTRFLQSGPLFHGSMVIALDYLAAGCPVFVLERFTPQDCLRAVENWKAEHAFLVPSMVRLLLETKQLADSDVSSWRLLLHGAAPMPTDLADAARQALGVDLQTIYGITEGGGPVLTLRPDDTPGTPMISGAACVGLPMTGTAARVRDGDGNDLGHHEIGTLHLTGDGLMQGYWADQTATTAAVSGGWLNTGDIAYVDEHGYCWILDRRDDLILRGGQNVYPAEVERVLRDHTAVADAAVAPGASRVWGQVPVAFVQAAPDVDASALVEHCARFLSSYKRPARFVFVESIPRNPAGKILRRLLREQANEAVGGQEGDAPGSLGRGRA